MNEFLAYFDATEGSNKSKKRDWSLHHRVREVGIVATVP